MSFIALSCISRQRLQPLLSGRYLLICTGLVLTFCTALILVFPPLFFQQAELRLYDIMLDGRATSSKSGIPVIVGIDEESLNAYGQWPWPRYRLAGLVEKLQGLGAGVVVLDFLMPESDRTSPDVIKAEWRRDLGLSLQNSGSISADTNSERLAKVLAKAPSVLGCYLDFTGGSTSGAGGVAQLPSGLTVSAPKVVDAEWPAPTGMIRNVSVLAAAVGAEGFTNAQHDIDGVLRRVHLLLRHNETYYPSLALDAILLASDERGLRIIRDTFETLLVWGDLRIPLDRQGNLLIDFRKKKSFPYISAKKILEGNPDGVNLRGKIVLVGAWAKGLGDSHQVPSGQSLNGVEIHATVIDNILSGTFISYPEWARGGELFAVLLLGILSTLFLSRSGYVFSLLSVAIMTGGIYWAGRELLLSKGVFISPLLPMTTPIIIMMVLSLLKYGLEARKVRQGSLDLIEAQDAIIVSMSALAEARDEDSGKHIMRTQRYVETLTRQLAESPQYTYLDEPNIELLTKSAPLHDIGKVGIPDNILCKPGRLTTEEYDIIKNHTLIGGRVLSKTIGRMEHPGKQAFLHYALQMAETHHEKWDGSGYPKGLSGTEIPLAGRLMALADVYDALVSRRSYKRKFSYEEASELIFEESGKHFDPEIVVAFMAKRAEFIRIAKDFSDED